MIQIFKHFRLMQDLSQQFLNYLVGGKDWNL